MGEPGFYLIPRHDTRSFTCIRNATFLIVKPPLQRGSEDVNSFKVKHDKAANL